MAVAEVAAPAADLLVNQAHLPFALDGGIASRAAIGLIVLATDQTLEHEFRAMLRLDGVAFYESRIHNSAAINPTTLAAMERDLTGAASLILPGSHLDVIGYGCTSGTVVIGEEKVFGRIRAARPGIACTTPITAAIAGMKALGARRIALLTPYVDSVNRLLRDFILARGLAVPAVGSFNHEDDREVARMTTDSVKAAVRGLAALPAVDGVFVSCTSLRVAAIAEELEAETGKPVTSSNHALAWHCLRLAGCRDVVPGFGRLFGV